MQNDDSEERFTIIKPKKQDDCTSDTIHTHTKRGQRIVFYIVQQAKRLATHYTNEEV